MKMFVIFWNMLLIAHRLLRNTVICNTMLVEAVYVSTCNIHVLMGYPYSIHSPWGFCKQKQHCLAWMAPQAFAFRRCFAKQLFCFSFASWFVGISFGSLSLLCETSFWSRLGCLGASWRHTWHGGCFELWMTYHIYAMAQRLLVISVWLSRRTETAQRLLIACIWLWKGMIAQRLLTKWCRIQKHQLQWPLCGTLAS